MTLNINEVCWLDLIEAGKQIHAGQFTSTELTQAMLSRIAALDTQLHSYALVTADLALTQAARADEQLASGQNLGPLHGVPIALKDLCDTAQITTTGGMWIHRERVPQQDATVVARLRAAGAVLLGKLQMTEGAFSAHHPKFSVPVNPWGESLWSGVSSSGSGVATAAGLTFGSLGSDTLGSIRFPCAANGLTGLKPTWGRVSRAGVMDLAASMDHIGPMTRSARDAAAMLAAIAGSDPADPTASSQPVPDYIAALTPNLNGLRIGIDRRLIESDAQAQVAKACFEAASVMQERGAQIVDIQLPDMTAIVRDALQLSIAEAAVTHAPTFDTHVSDYGPVLRGLIESGREVSAAEIINIGYRREIFAGQMAAAMDGVDIVLLPAMNVAAPTNEELARQHSDLAARLARLLFTAPIDMTRQPSLTLPAGLTGTGAPIAFQLVGRLFDEVSILRAGHVYQQATDWHQQRPPLAS